MKRSTTILVFILLLATTSTALAGMATGSTKLFGTPISGASVEVNVTVVTNAPVVAYEYALQNECYFSGKTTGKGGSYQQDPIANWVYSSPSSNGDVPHATMSVTLVTVPSGSVCKVFVVKGNQMVKGSTTTYTVQ